MSRCVVVASLLLCFGALAGCGKIDVDPPAGFARFERDSGAHAGAMRAVSPEGVVLRIRKTSVEEKADLTFWKQALKKRMLDAGYAFVAESELSSQSGPGHLLELAAPVGPRDYGYLIALFVKDKELVIAEAAGEVLHLRRHKKAIVDSLASLRY